MDKVKGFPCEAAEMGITEDESCNRREETDTGDVKLNPGTTNTAATQLVTSGYQKTKEEVIEQRFSASPYLCVGGTADLNSLKINKFHLLYGFVGG